MNAKRELATLFGEIGESLKALEKMENFIVSYERDVLDAGTTGIEQALALSQALGNYYTCIETIFFRISQFFENSLPQNRWHQALLEKMTLEIPEIRPKVISYASYQGLSEILKFRHFSRYYYEFDYDWDKLRFLLLKFNAVRETVKKEINDFVSVLKGI
jgi:hypothetical protein